MTLRSAAAVLVSSSLLSAVACSDPETSPQGECTPACGANQFCCLGTCQQVGSVCGDESGGAPSPDGGGGAGVGGAGGTGGAGGAGDPCAPHDGATAVVTACQDGVTLYCQLGETEPCNPGYVCVEWVDPSTHVLDAYCAMEGETDICDPDYDSSSCQGNVAHECIGVAGPNDPPTAPGHYQDFDCVALYGAESVCMVDDVTAHPTCTMP